MPSEDDEALLLALLNGEPSARGAPQSWQLRVGGTGTLQETYELRYIAKMLRSIVRGEVPPEELRPLMARVSRVPYLGPNGVSWTLQTPDNIRLSVRAVLAWSDLTETSPGRLRPCANPECPRFLIDHSRAGTARWCSMDRCGNRLKARDHYARTRTALIPDSVVSE